MRSEINLPVGHSAKKMALKHVKIPGTQVKGTLIVSNGMNMEENRLFFHPCSPCAARLAYQVAAESGGTITR